MSSPSTFTTKPVIGVISSAGGSALEACWPLLEQLSVGVCIATDRPCGIEDKFKGRVGCQVQRFEYRDAQKFSHDCADFFKQNGVQDLVLLFFTRFVGIEVYQPWSCVNFHPTLLPLFPGLGSLRKLRDSGAKVIGATAHVVDDSCDGGRILAQISNAAPDVDRWEKILYLQKTYLLALVLDHYLHGNFSAFIQGKSLGGYTNASPALVSEKFLALMLKLSKDEGVPLLGLP